MNYTTCVHECGHGAACYLLGAVAHAGPLTIVPSGGYLGCCYMGRTARPSDADMRALGAPYPLYPARLRRRYESAMMGLLAGQVTEDIWLARGDIKIESYSGGITNDHEQAEVIVLPQRESDLLDRAAAADSRSDLENAWEIAVNLHGGDETIAARHLSFLQGETQALMSGARAGRLVRALAAELQVHRTLPAKRWLAILPGGVVIIDLDDKTAQQLLALVEEHEKYLDRRFGMVLPAGVVELAQSLRYELNRNRKAEFNDLAAARMARWRARQRGEDVPYRSPGPAPSRAS